MTPPAVGSATGRRSHGLLLGAARLFNPLVLRLAGTRLMPLYGVLEHRGRRSGRLFRTPVVVRPIPGGFVVPTPWGDSSDWYRNVRAAGGCVIRWKGSDYQMVDPELVDVAEAGAAFGGPLRPLAKRFGVTQCLRLRHAPAPAGVA